MTALRAPSGVTIAPDGKGPRHPVLLDIGRRDAGYAVTGSGPPFVKAANWLTHLDFDLSSALRAAVEGVADFGPARIAGTTEVVPVLWR